MAAIDKLVLIVEDDPDLQGMLQMAVEQLVGARVVIDNTVHGVLEQVEKQKPSFLLLDTALSGSADLVKSLKDDPRTRCVPVLGVHTRGRMTCAEARSIGYDACFGNGDVLDMEALARQYLREHGGKAA